jgi:hypothetical protein
MTRMTRPRSSAAAELADALSLGQKEKAIQAESGAVGRRVPRHQKPQIFAKGAKFCATEARGRAFALRDGRGKVKPFAAYQTGPALRRRVAETVGRGSLAGAKTSLSLSMANGLRFTGSHEFSDRERRISAMASKLSRTAWPRA